ncbi:alpha/beta hydrolase fold [Niastella yeongjuensis]|nr:alpha/beta hydrolase fold [Niastella yeongjuensis]
MKKYFFTTLAIFGLMANSGKAQQIDTLLDVGGYRLFFHIIKGKGMPILFHNGSGADVTIWDTILKPIAAVTHATLITYDRAGFGKSELDSSNQELDKHGIQQGLQGLETALKKLGYNGKIMLIASSYGGFYAALQAAKQPATVKSVVLVDANHVGWFTDTYVADEMKDRIKDSATVKKQNLGFYYQSLNLQNTVELLKKTPFPATVPVIDIVSEINFPDSVRSTRWSISQKQFVAAQPNRQGITAHGCRHVIFKDNPALVVNAVVKAYTGAVGKEQGNEIMKRFISYSLEALNHTPCSTK